MNPSTELLEHLDCAFGEASKDTTFTIYSPDGDDDVKVNLREYGPAQADLGCRFAISAERGGETITGNCAGTVGEAIVAMYQKWQDIGLEPRDL